MQHLSTYTKKQNMFLKHLVKPSAFQHGQGAPGVAIGICQVEHRLAKKGCLETMQLTIFI